MAFDQVLAKSVPASNLLKLFSFLNPDGILISFLEDGKIGIHEGVGLNGPYALNSALRELERFSLIRRQTTKDVNPQIVIHHVTQSAIQDQMSLDERSSFESLVVDLCERAFPTKWDEEISRTKCRDYEGQVTQPLLKVSNQSPLYARLLQRVGAFLDDNSRYQQAKAMCIKAIEVFSGIGGVTHLDTLSAKSDLAFIYGHQGLLNAAS